MLLDVCSVSKEKRSQPRLALATGTAVLLFSEAGGMRGQQILGL